jgi:hypothetical protein
MEGHMNDLIKLLSKKVTAYRLNKNRDNSFELKFDDGSTMDVAIYYYSSERYLHLDIHDAQDNEGWVAIK